MLTTVALLKTKQDKLCVYVCARERVCVYTISPRAREKPYIRQPCVNDNNQVDVERLPFHDPVSDEKIAQIISNYIW